MKRTLSTSEAAHELLNDKNASWSYAGAYALAEYLGQLEESTGEELEFDCVAIRCDFSEYETALDAANEYDFEPSDPDDRGATEDEALDYLRGNTEVIEFDGGIIIQQF